MTTVNQPSAMPTRKLTAATVATAGLEVSRLVVSNLAPEWYDPGVWAAMMPLAVFATGYIVRDRPNVPAPEMRDDDDGGEEFLA